MALLSVVNSPAAAQEPGANYIERLRLQAQLQSLNADLLSQDSATAVLQALCDRRLTDAPRILARPIAVADDVALATAARHELDARSDQLLRRRHVELACGETVLSRADNWYLPGALTPGMNAALEGTEIPFGVVVRPLGFQRRTLEARLLFSPLPYGWEAQDPVMFDAPVTLPADVLQHRAVLQTPDGCPFALLIETYAAAVLLP